MSESGSLRGEEQDIFWKNDMFVWTLNKKRETVKGFDS